MAVIPFAEWRPDVSDINSTYTQTILNALPRGDGYGPFNDLSGYSTAMAAACRGGYYALKTDGSVAVFAATLNRIYMMDNSTLAWTDVSKGGSAYSDIPSTDNWGIRQFGNYVIAVQANSVPQVFDLTSSSAFADLGGSPPTARYIDVVGRFVVLSGLVSNPYRVHWSGLNAVTTWTSGTNSSDYQDLPDGGIVRGVAGGETGVIFQDRTIRRMTYAPGSPIIFQIERIADDNGLYASGSLIRASEHVFFLSPKGFHRVSPGEFPQQIGKERVDRTFFASLDITNLQLVIGAADPKNSRVFWAYKSLTGASGRFDTLLCFDYALDRWSKISLSGEYIMSISQPGITLDALDSVSSSLDALTGSLDSYLNASSPEIAGFTTSHALGFFRGSALEATLETAEQKLGPKRVFVRGVTPITDASGAYCSVSKRENAQSTRTYTTEAVVNARGYSPQRGSAMYARGKLRVPAGTVWTFASGMEPDATTQGIR